MKTGDRTATDALPGERFLQRREVSESAFRQHRVSTRPAAPSIADGNLTLRGVTKPVSLDVAFKPQASGATLDVSGSVKRLDFGVGSGDYADTSVIGADVKVTAHLQLAPK